MAIAVAQQQRNPTASTLSVATGTTQTVAITPTNAGCTLVVLARGQGGTNTPSAADNVNTGAYTRLDTFDDGNANWTTFIHQNCAASATTITVTWPTTNANRGLIVLEVSGAVTMGGASGHAIGNNNSSGNMTTAAAAALVIGFGCTEGGSTWVVGSGFTGGTVAWAGGGDGVLPESKRVTTATNAAVFTGGTAGDPVFGVLLDEATAGGNTMTVAATSPVSTMAAGLASTDSLTVAATSPVSTAVASLASTDSLAIAATSPVSTMAAAVKSTDSLAVAAVSPVSTMAATLALVQNVIAIAATSPVSTAAASLASTDSLTVAATSPVDTCTALMAIPSLTLTPITMPIPYTARMT